MIKRFFVTTWLVVLAWVVVPMLGRAAAIQSIEINQAIGVQKNGNLKFVAGKNTVIRALMAGTVVVDPTQTSATIRRDGQVVATLSPDVSTSAVSVVDFQCPTRAKCGDWAAGSYVFDVKVNGETKSTAGTTYRFVERAGLRVLALPVKANYGGTVVPVSGDSWKATWEFTRNVYPVAADKFTWTLREELDASDKSFDLETNDGRFALWEALVKLMPPHCLANKNADGCFDKIIGFIQSRPSGYPNGTLQGYTYGNPANIAVATDEDAAATVAHEVAHTLGIGDAYDGGSFNCAANPVPDLFSGKNFNDPTLPEKCTAGRVQLPGVSGTLIPAAHHPYEVGGRGLLGDTAEYMGSGGLQKQFWTSQDAYDWIFDKLVPVPAGTSVPTRAGTLATTPTQRLIEFFGTIKQNAKSSADVVVEPWEAFLDDDVVTDPPLEGIRGALGDDAPTVDDADAMCEFVGLREVLGREEDRHAELLVQASHFVPDGGPAHRVEAGRGFVEEEHVRVVHECRREVETPLHAARVGPDPSAEGLAEVDEAADLVDPASGLVPGEAVEEIGRAHV